MRSKEAGPHTRGRRLRAQAPAQRAGRWGSSHRALQEGGRRKKPQLLSWPDPHSPPACCSPSSHPAQRPATTSALLGLGPGNCPLSALSGWVSYRMCAEKRQAPSQTEGFRQGPSAATRQRPQCQPPDPGLTAGRVEAPQRALCLGLGPQPASSLPWTAHPSCPHASRISWTPGPCYTHHTTSRDIPACTASSPTLAIMFSEPNAALSAPTMLCAGREKRVLSN